MGIVSHPGNFIQQCGETYIPLGLDLLQSHKCLRYRVVSHERLVLLQRPLADLGVVDLGDSVFEECLLEFVEGDNNAEDLGQGILQVAFGACVGEFHLLWWAGSCQSEAWIFGHAGHPRHTSSKLMVADNIEFGT